MPELCLTVKNQTPPNNYRYTDPTTGVKFQHYDYNAFFDAIASHRLGNDIPLDPFWREEVASKMCEDNLPLWKDFCKRCDADPSVARPFSLEAAKSFLKFIGKWLAGGGGYVSQEEANRRAQICAGCQWQRPAAAKCGACYNVVLELVMTLTKGKETPFTDQLSTCGLCSCNNAVSVWMPLEAQTSAYSEETKERIRNVPWCWKNGETL